MKATELRIGNHAYTTTGNEKIIDIKDLIEIDNGNIQSVGIPLTEEWLLRFGFERLKSIKNVHRIIHDGSTFYLYKYGNEFDWQFGDHKLCDFKYVHTLQNLYFALTGQELTTK